MSAVVVGAGLGGLCTAEELRRAGYRQPITLIGGEEHVPYDRPPLTKAVLRGEVDDTEFRARAAALDAVLLLGTRVTRVDVEAQFVELENGARHAYGDLVLAPGAVPRRLPGTAGRTGVHVVRTIDDVLALRATIRRTKRVAVIGGGFIGCEVAASAASVGIDVDLIEALPGPLARALGPAGSKLVEELLVSRGVRVHTKARIVGLTGEPSVTGVELVGGAHIATSDVVLALGVEPDTGWLEGSGIELGNGISCDAGGRTCVPHVWAVGDAANWYQPLVAEQRRIEHWSSVIEQAGVVASNIVSDEARAEADGVPYFWSDIFDVKLQALGFIDPDDDAQAVGVGGDARVIVYSRRGRLTGLVGFSAGRAIMRLRPRLGRGANAAADEVIAALAGA